MILRTRITIIILFLSSILTTIDTFAQTAEEKKALSSVLYENINKPVYIEIHQNSNEAQYLFSRLFIFYKTFFSSQDSYQCSFYPSCSEYGLLAIRRLGIAQGMLSTFDRLMRCNGVSPEKYTIDIQRGALIDDVENK